MLKNWRKNLSYRSLFGKEKKMKKKSTNDIIILKERVKIYCKRWVWWSTRKIKKRQKERTKKKKFEKINTTKKGKMFNRLNLRQLILGHKKALIFSIQKH